MDSKPYDPVVTTQGGRGKRQLWNVKFFDGSGNPRNVACPSEGEAQKMCQLIRVAGDFVLSPFQIVPHELPSGKRQYMTLGHVNKSLFVALVNFEFTTDFHPDDAQHTYVRPHERDDKAELRFGFDECHAEDAHAFAATYLTSD
jgi:hypothetical protein